MLVDLLIIGVLTMCIVYVACKIVRLFKSRGYATINDFLMLLLIVIFVIVVLILG